MNPDTLKKIPIFSDVPDDALKKVATFVTLIEAPEGKAIVREGDFSNDFYAIESGEVSVAREGEHLADLGPGSVFGEQGLLGRQARNASVTAKTPVRLLQIGIPELARMQKAMPEVVEQLKAKAEELQDD